MSRFEVEQKYRIDQPRAVKQLLKKYRAAKKSEGLEVNQLYDNGQLRKKGYVLRLRRHGKEEKLTFKGPRLKGAFKKRVEVEIPVDYKKTEKILGFLGFKPFVGYRKTREEYHAGPVHIAVDHVGKYGWFVEIEGPVKAILKWEKKLNLKRSQREERSYLEILYGKRGFH